MINDKIDKILSDLHGYELPLTGEVTIDADIDYGNRVVRKEKGEAKQALLTLIEEVFEECKPEEIDTDGAFGKYPNGWNEAIDQFEANFKKVMGE